MTALLAIVEQVAEELLKAGPRRAMELKLKLGLSLPVVNEALAAGGDRFQRDRATLKWRLQEQVRLDTARPGPFGPARDLIPVDQVLVFAHAEDPAGLAIQNMMDHGYSQVPVVDANERVVGVFSYAMFSCRIAQAGLGKEDPRELAVENFMDRAPEFIGPDVYIDTSVDWSRRDFVLVGSPEELVGVLSITDVWAALNDFAEGFVFLYEIERDLRLLIEREFAEDLGIYFDELNTKRAKRHLSPVKKLEELSFSEYESAIFSQTHVARFDGRFAGKTSVIHNEFRSVNEIRNDAFHFRRRISVKDTQLLRRFHGHVQRALNHGR